VDIVGDIKRTFKEGSVLTRLIYINLGVFLLVKILGVFFYLAGQPYLLVDWLSIPSDINQLITKPWTPITYMFMHVGFLHLLFNVLGLYWFGKLFLYHLEGDKLLSVYLLGGLAGAILYVAAYNIFPIFENSNSILLGASGSVFAILVAIAFYDPNPVVMFEHKGLYWSKVPGTNDAKTIEPDEDYVVPLGKGRVFLEANKEKVDSGETMLAIAWGMGVHWANNAAKDFPGQVEVLDIRSIYPLDEELIYERVKKHGKCLVITEEPAVNSFAQSIAGRINEHCFEYLDGPVKVIGAENMPAIPFNEILERAMLPNAEKVAAKMKELLDY